MKVTQRLFAAVGRTCHEWSLLEDELRKIVICLGNNPTFHALVAGENGRNLIRTCRRLTPYSRTLDDGDEAELLECLMECDSLALQRNRIAHSSWSRTTLGSDLYFLSMSRYAPDARKVSANRSRLKSFSESGYAALEDVVGVADRIARMQEHLVQFRLRAFEVQPMPFLPPRGWDMFANRPDSLLVDSDDGDGDTERQD